MRKLCFLLVSASSFFEKWTILVRSFHQIRTEVQIASQNYFICGWSHFLKSVIKKYWMWTICTNRWRVTNQNIWEIGWKCKFIQFFSFLFSIPLIYDSWVILNGLNWRIVFWKFRSLFSKTFFNYRNWRKRHSNTRSKSLLSIILRTFWKEFVLLAVINFCSEILFRLAQPIFLSYLLKFYRYVQ